MLKVKSAVTQPQTTDTTPPVVADPSTIRRRISELAAQLTEAKTLYDAFLANGQALILGGANPLDLASEGDRHRANIGALESAISNLERLLDAAVKEALHEHVHAYSGEHAKESEIIRVLAVDKLAVALSALDDVLAAAAAADSRLNAIWLDSRLALGQDRNGGDFVRVRELALVNVLSPLRSQVAALLLSLR